MFPYAIIMSRAQSAVHGSSVQGRDSLTVTQCGQPGPGVPEVKWGGNQSVNIDTPLIFSSACKQVSSSVELYVLIKKHSCLLDGSFYTAFKNESGD